MELTTDRCVRLVGTEYLAGSAIELARGIENSVRFAGISLKECKINLIATIVGGELVYHAGVQ